MHFFYFASNQIFKDLRSRPAILRRRIQSRPRKPFGQGHKNIRDPVQKFREPERTSQMEAIGTSVGLNSLPRLAAHRTLLARLSTLAHIVYSSKPWAVWQEANLFSHTGWLFLFGLGPRPRLLSFDGFFRVASVGWDCN